MTALSSGSSRPLKGRCRVPGDKSISHRALILGSLAIGRTRIKGLLEGEDVLRTAQAMRDLGARIERGPDGSWNVDGVGIGGWREPDGVLDLGNSGTGARLLMGAVATHPFTTFFTGDASLAPPADGAGDRAAVTFRRALHRPRRRTPAAGRNRHVVAAADRLHPAGAFGAGQIGGAARGPERAGRDHGDRAGRHARPYRAHAPAFRRADRDRPGRRRAAHHAYGRARTARGRALRAGRSKLGGVPAGGGADHQGSEITLWGVGVNPLRTGLFSTLAEMGAEIDFAKPREQGGEPVADLRIRASELHGVEVPAERAPSMIDEYPMLAVAAAFAKGRTVMHGLGELRVKESDRLAAIAAGLKRLRRPGRGEGRHA